MRRLGGQRASDSRVGADRSADGIPGTVPRNDRENDARYVDRHAPAAHLPDCEEVGGNRHVVSVTIHAVAGATVALSCYFFLVVILLAVCTVCADGGARRSSAQREGGVRDFPWGLG